MKNRLKVVYFDMFLEAIELESNIKLTEAEKRSLCNLLATQAVHVHDANFDALKEQYEEVLKDQEKTRTQFIGFINFIEKSTKVMLDYLRKMSLISYDYDAVKKKTILKSRTSVVQELVNFCNKMNDLVIKFYNDVYKIDLVDDKDKNQDQIQGKLF
jgi:hypothetical protein